MEHLSILQHQLLVSRWSLLLLVAVVVAREEGSIGHSVSLQLSATNILPKALVGLAGVLSAISHHRPVTCDARQSE